MAERKERKIRIPTKPQAVIIMLIIIVMIGGSVLFLGIDAQVAIIFALFFAVIVGLCYGYSFNFLEQAAYDGIKETGMVVTFNIFIGLVIASWIAGGIIPYLIYWGLAFLTPALLPAIACVVCAAMSVMIGSSWTTAGTVGLAFFGIARTIGVPDALIVGAIVSGSFFGDKQSPLSETTVFAAGVSKVRLMDHVSSMRYSTLPALGLSIILFAILGIQYGGEMDYSQITEVRTVLANTFTFNPILLIPPIVLIAMLVKKINSLFCLGIAVLMGALLALIMQGTNIATLAAAFLNGQSMDTGSAVVDAICAKGGINSMWYVISIVIVGFSMSKILEKTKVYEVFVSVFDNKLKTPRGVILASLLVGLLITVGVAASYVTALIMSACFIGLYNKFGIDRRVLSRSIEDTTTIMQVFVPWSMSAIFFCGLFGCDMTTLASCYFIGYFNPVISILLAITGYGVFYTNGRRGWGKNKYKHGVDEPISMETTKAYYAAQGIIDEE